MIITSPSPSPPLPPPPPPSSPAPAPPPPHMVSAAGRVRRANTLYNGDFQPSYTTSLPKFLKPPAPPLSDAAAAELGLPIDSSSNTSASVTCTPGPPELVTTPDKFGVYRVYQYLPSREPDEEIKPEHVADSPDIAGAGPRSRPGWWIGLGSVVQTILRRRTPVSSDYAPFLNPTTLSLMKWYYQVRTSTMSLLSIQRLVDEVIFAEDWDREELRGFKARTANAAFDKARKAHAPPPDTSQDEGMDTDPPFASTDDWHKATVQFWVPKEGRRLRGGARSIQHMTVGPVWHRKIMKVLQTAIQNPSTGPDMHLTPFRMYWSPDAARDHDSPPPSPLLSDDSSSSSSSSASSASSSTSSSAPSSFSGTSPDSTLPHGGERLYGEVYVGDAMNREHEEIRANLPKTHIEPYPETVVAAILLYSDSTHLAQFGNTSLWPAYGWFANWTKYDRGKPSSFAAHHLAYIPSVSSTKFVCFLSLSDSTIASIEFPGHISENVRRYRGDEGGHCALQTRAYAGCLGPPVGRRFY